MPDGAPGAGRREALAQVRRGQRGRVEGREGGSLGGGTEVAPSQDAPHDEDRGRGDEQHGEREHREGAEGAVAVHARTVAGSLAAVTDAESAGPVLEAAWRDLTG